MSCLRTCRSEGAQEGEQGRAFGARHGDDALFRRLRLAAVPEDRFEEAARAAVVQEERVAAHGLREPDAPERGRAPFAARCLALGPAVIAEPTEANLAAAEGGEAYDQQIGEGNAAGNARVQAAIDALTSQTSAIEGAVAALDLAAIDFEGSDSLDDPEAVFE